MARHSVGQRALQLICVPTRYASGAPNVSRYDVIVVGGGHAGCEAAHASARMGCSTLLLTHKISTIGQMSCNPSFGGIGKGHLMKEIDALDGVCGRICDKSGIHYKMLNRSKGPAVWGPRAQIDRSLYKTYMQQEMLNTENLDVIEGTVEDLKISTSGISDVSASEDRIAQCQGIVMKCGTEILSSSVVLTAGTFLRGQINIGLDRVSAGRKGDPPSIGLAETIEKLGFKMGRLKTGTPPRILSESINYNQCQTWNPDQLPTPFSFLNDKVWIAPEDQLPCFTTTTNPEIKSIILDSLHLNAHVSEEISGPRYCPSIESKVLRFGNKEHYLWIEPEGLDTKIMYLQGFSCTMPEEYQLKAIRLIKGLENAVISQPGYGVEYDFMDPRQIFPTMETKKVSGLFFAGQINGTTGYEEAAAQGIMAGINAARKVQRKKFFLIHRSEGYIGVLVDDLTTQGTNEPYRMFTSRTEFRMTLRPDNADARLTMKAYSEAGCVSTVRYNRTKKTLASLESMVGFLKSVKKTRSEWGRFVDTGKMSSRSTSAISAFDLIAHYGEAAAADVYKMFPNELGPAKESQLLRERLKTLSLYEKIVFRQQQEIEELRKEEELIIPGTIDYSLLPLKSELCEKLARARPMNLASASRVQGMTPAALLTLLHFIKKYSPI